MAKVAIFQERSQQSGSLIQKLTNAGNEIIRLDESEPEFDLAEDIEIIILSTGDRDIEVFTTIKRRYPDLPILVTTDYADAEFAITMMSEGAMDVLETPTSSELLNKVVEKAVHKANVKEVAVGETAASNTQEFPLVGNSAAMMDVYKEIGRVAAVEATVLIHGETGTGKELVARAVHAHSLRSDNPFITLNCAAIPTNLLESKLFGHEKGAFTGATDQRIGKFEQADGATIFLDEIGELPLETQAKLLRVLEYKHIERLGNNTPIQVDVRIIAATNRDLEAEVVEGRFREDLYHRLNVLPITLPPLRERREDIPLLVDFFASRLSQEESMDMPSFSARALDMLSNQDWPGNVRELQHCIQRAAVLSGGYTVTADEIHEILEQQPDTRQGHSYDDEMDVVKRMAKKALHEKGKSPMRDFTEMAEATILREALLETGGNQTQAAKLLGVSRPSVQAKMKKYGVESHTIIGD